MYLHVCVHIYYSFLESRDISFHQVSAMAVIRAWRTEGTLCTCSGSVKQCLERRGCCGLAQVLHSTLIPHSRESLVCRSQPGLSHVAQCSLVRASCCSVRVSSCLCWSTSPSCVSTQASRWTFGLIPCLRCYEWSCYKHGSADNSYLC